VRLTEDQVSFLSKTDNASALLRRLIDQERLRSAVEDSSNKKILANAKIEELDEKIKFLKKKMDEVEGQLKNQIELREFYGECSEFLNKAKEKGMDYAKHLSLKHAGIRAARIYSTKHDEVEKWEVKVYQEKREMGVWREPEDYISFKGSEKECLDQVEKWVNENLAPISQEELRFKKACEALEEEIKVLEDKKAAMVKEFLQM